MSLQVKEIFGPTIQGEGPFGGHKAIFVRLAGCNMWNGKEETRAASKCPYCDTDFVGGSKMDVMAITAQIDDLAGTGTRLVVITGGEPLLQDIIPLADVLLEAGFRVQVETNGTQDYTHLFTMGVVIVVSPKTKTPVLKYAHCLKVLHPHPTLGPEDFNDFEAAQKVLQPIDDPQYTDNLQGTVKKLLTLGPEWSIGIQLHKLLGVE